MPSGNVISGYVFNDLNNNGLLDAGEKGIANVPLELLNASGAVIAAAVADANGYYQFNTDNTISTAPVTLQRAASVPLSATDWTQALSIAQFDPALGTLTAVDIVNAGSITSDIKVENVDAASATITATVSGSLTLSGAGFNALVTNGSSSKTFNAGPFDGSIDFGGTSGHDFGPQTATGSTTFTITSPSALANYIGTGMVSLTEVAHATSSASGAGNLIAQIATTASAQVSVIYHYVPSASLKPGTYTIVETQQPPGYLNGLLSTNGSVIPNSVGEHAITVTLGTNAIPNNDFAAIAPSSLDGYVYMDANDNGIHDPGEAGILGVALTLTGSNDLGSVNLAATTAADGSYQFTDLRPGNYTITETEPAGYLHGKNALGSLGGTPLSNEAMSVGLATGAAGANYNFAELTPASLSGFVYLDANNNGVKDPGESGIGGVTITLAGANDQGPVNLVTTTAADGSYQFRNLRPGSYEILETEPAGYTHGTNTLGSPGGTILGNLAMAVNVSAATVGTNYNFAELELPGSLAGYVYLDANGNGVKDPGESGIAGVTVTLTGISVFGQPVNVAQTTASDGSYKFLNVLTGSYTITETQPAGYIHGQETLGTAGGILGDHQISSIALNPGVAATNYDFAELPLTSLPTTVFADSFTMPATFAHPLDVTILSKLQFLSSTNVVDPNVVAEASFVDGLYRHVLDRPADTAGLISWVQALQSGVPRAEVVSAVWNSAEHRGLEVDRLYETFLGRSPDAAGSAYWVNAMLAGASEMDVARALIASPEFQADHPDDASYVTALYTTILQRSPNSAEVAGWVAALQNGASRDSLAVAFLNSSESYQLVLSSAYTDILHRAPDAAGYQGWLSQLLSGQTTPALVCQSFLASEEFFNLAVTAGTT